MSATLAPELIAEPTGPVVPGLYGVGVIRNHDEAPSMREHLYVPVPAGRAAALALIVAFADAEKVSARALGYPADEITHVHNDCGDHTVRYGGVRWCASLSLPDIYADE